MGQATIAWLPWGAMRGPQSRRSSEESLHSVDFRTDATQALPKSMPRNGSHADQTSPAEVSAILWTSPRALSWWAQDSLVFELNSNMIGRGACAGTGWAQPCGSFPHLMAQVRDEHFTI